MLCPCATYFTSIYNIFGHLSISSCTDDGDFIIKYECLQHLNLTSKVHSIYLLSQLLVIVSNISKIWNVIEKNYCLNISKVMLFTCDFKFMQVICLTVDGCTCVIKMCLRMNIFYKLLNYISEKTTWSLHTHTAF